MKCPVCESKETRVIEVRSKWNTTGYTRRRRECLECDYRFSTYEIEPATLNEIFEKHIEDPQVLATIAEILDKEFPTLKQGRPKRRKQIC